MKYRGLYAVVKYREEAQEEHELLAFFLNIDKARAYRDKFQDQWPQNDLNVIEFKGRILED